MTALPDGADVHPASFVTVNVNDAAGIPEIVVLDPVPVFVVPPGVLVIVHVPVGGNPFNVTLPVATVHVG